MPDNNQQSLLDLVREMPIEKNYLDLVREMGMEKRQQTAPGGMEAQAAGETAGAMLSSGLTPFGFQRGAEALSVVMAKLFGDEGTGQLAEQIYRADDKTLQAGGGIRDTVGRSLAGMTAATVRGAATTIEAVVPDAVDPMAKVEGFTRGMANTAAVTSDTFTDKVTAAVTNGVANIALGVAAPIAAPALFFLQGAGGAANEYDQAYIDGMLSQRDGIYKPGDKYIAALKGGVIEGVTEWLGAKSAKYLGATFWGKQAAKSIEKMNPAMKFAVGTGLAYASEAAEEGGASIAYSLTKDWQGQERPEFWDGAKEAFADAFYGGFGGAGAHPLIAVGEAAQAKRMRNRISAEIARSNNAFADPDFWDAMPKATVDAMRAMSPQERQAELSSARDAYHQSNADRQAGAAALNSAASALDNAQKELSRANKRGKQDAIDAATKNVEAAQAGFDSAFSNQSILGAELLAARTRLMTIAAFNGRNTPTIKLNTTDVLAAEKLSVAAPTSDTDSKVQSEMESLGYDVQFYDPTDPNDTRPAFYSPSTPNTVYLRSGMKESEFAAAMGYAYHEVIHVIQATDGDLYKALRQSFDEQSTVEAGVQYFNDKLRADDRLAQTAAGTIAAEVGGVSARPMMQGQMVEERAGRALLKAEGEAQITQSAMEEFFKTGKAPGLLGRVIIKLGLRGKQAATALRVRSVLMKGAQERIARKAAPAKVGSEVALTEFGRQMVEAMGVAGAVQMAETAPAPTAPATTAAAPAAAAAAPSAAPVPPSASEAVLTASGMTPAEAARAETPDFKAMVNLAVNNIRKGDKTFAQGKRLYPIMAAMESDPSTLSDDDRQIGRQMQQEMYAEFGPKYATLWARPSKPKSDVGHKREKATGRYVGAPDWIGGSPAKLKQLRTKLRQLALEGEDGKMWYENSSRAILDIVNGDVDEAEKIVALIAIYSPNATVPANMAMALTAYYQWKAGVEIKAGLGSGNEKATDLLVNGKAWSGIKTNSFYQNLMVEIAPEKLDEGVATMDMWMALAFDYGDKALDQGPKYKFSEREIQRLAGELGWKAHQVQAAIWTAMKGRIDPIRADLKEQELKVGIGEMVTKVDPETKEVSDVYRVKKDREYDHFKLAHKMGMARAITKEGVADSKYDFSNAINDRLAQLSWEATPSTATGRSLPGIHTATTEQKFEYLNAIRDILFKGGRDVIADMAGLPQGRTFTGFSAWGSQVGAGAQTLVPVPMANTGKNRAIKPEAKKLLNLASLIKGFVLEQDSVVYHTPIWEEAKIRHNGISLMTDRALDESEMNLLYQKIYDRFGMWDLAPGYREDGIRVLNFVEGLKDKDFQQGMKEVLSSLPDDFGGGTVRVKTFRSDGNYLGNNWEKNPNGEDYLSEIQSDRPDLLDGVRDLRRRVQAVNQDFNAKYGWGSTAVYAARRKATVDASVIRAGSLGVAREYGNAVAGASRFTGIHFSGESRARLNSRFYGTGMRGAEASRVNTSEDDRLRHRVYFYVDDGNGVVPESGVGDQIHGVILNNIYDANRDPLKLRGRVKNANEFESAVADAGFDGVYFPKALSQRGIDMGAIALIGKRSVPVERKGSYNENVLRQMQIVERGGTLSARFKKTTGTPIETTTSIELAKRFEQRTTGVSEPIKNLINTLNSIITGRDLAALAPTANQQAVANATSGNYVEIYPSVRAKFMYLDETIMLSKKDVDGDGRIFAHELMHAATSVRIDDYVRRFFNEITRAPSGLIDPQLIAKYSEYNFTTKSGKAYMNGLAFMANHPKADPAMKELIDCFLEAAKSSPENYAIMTEGRMLRTGKYSYTGSNPIEVVEEQKMRKKYSFPPPGQTESVYEEVPYTQYQVVIKNETEKGDLVVGQYYGREQADAAANALRSGKPTNLLNSLFSVTGTGVVAETKMTGRGAVNQGQGGDVVTQRGGMYGFGNLHEFIAECANNPEFQNVLRKLPSKGRGGTVFTRLMNAIRQLLGLSEDKQTMLDDVMRLTEEIATVDMTAATQGRRQAVAGETAVQKTKKPSQYGFPVLNETKSIFEYSKRQQIYSITSKFPSVNLDTSNNIELQPIDLDVKVTIAFDKFAKQWLIESISTSMGDDYRIKDIAFELEQAGIRASGVVPGGKVGVANKINQLSKGIADNYQNDQVTRAEAISRAQSKPIVDLRGSVASSSVSLSARNPAPRFFDEVARGERKWALTDKAGNPVMVYHGTVRQSPVDPFVTKVGVRGEPMTRAGQKGMSFTDEPTFAESFGDQVYPAWISAKNPVTLEIGGRPYDRIPVWVAERLMMDYIDTYGIATHKIDAEFFDPDEISAGIESGWLKSETDEVPYTTIDYLAGYLLAEGYDAVVLKNVEDEGSQNRGAWRKTLHTEIVVGSKDPIINALTNLRTTDKEYRVLAARPSVSPEAKADVAAVAIFDVAKKRLGTLLNSLPKDKTKWSASDVAAVKDARKEVMAAVRGLKRKPKGADVGTMAYGMGRREGQVGGMIKGRKEGMREERERQRAEAIAKRKELRTSFVARVEKLRAQIEAAAEKNDVLRQRMEMMRKMERLNRDAAAERAGKRVIKAWFAGQQKGSTAGYNEAKREMKEIRKAAAEVIGTLPRSMRGKYIDAVARMKTAAGIDQIARRVVRDLAIAEAAETVGDINRLIKRVKKVGLRAETRTNLLTDLTAARSMLASGKKRLLPFTNTADLANRTAAARSLQEGVLHEFDMERQEYRDARDERAMEATADAIALGKTLALLPKIERGKLSSVAPKRGIVADILVSNSNADMYTLMQAIEGGANGILGKIWTGINAAKGSMTLARKSIDEKIDKALRDAGYNGYDGYATTAAGLYGDSAAESVSVTIGGKAMTITTDQLLNIAAMDQQTVDLLTDATDPAGDKGAPIVFSTDRNAKPMYLTKQEFDAIRANLSTGQRNLIDTMKSILDTDIRPAAFDIHFQIHGRQPSIVPGYFPRKRLGDEISEQGIDPNMQPGAVVNTMLSNAGFLQERVAAKSTMVIGGMMRTMDDHIEESLRLIHLSLPLRHAMSVLKSAAVRTGIEETMGDGGNDSIRKLVLNGVGLSGKPQGGLIEGINANISGALITINPKTWLRQIGGVFRLASEMPAGAWAAGVGRMIVMSPSDRSKMAQSIESINGYFYDRHRRSQVGIFANVLGNANNSKDRWASALQSSARSFRAIGEDVAAGRFTQAARDVREGVLPISRVMKSADGVLRIIDRQIMLAAFLGARADVMKTNPSMSAAEADVAAARLAEYAFRKTQNVSDPMDDTVFAARQKFSQGVGRLMFPFSSDPLKGYNQLRRAIVSRDPALIARTTAGITGNIATAAAINPLWMTAGLAIANALGGSGDDEDDEMIRRMEMEKQYRYLGPTIAADASAVAFGYLGMAAGAMIDGAMGSPERADDVLEPLVVRFLGDTTQYIAKGQMSMGAKAALQMAGVPVVAPFSTVESVYRAANPSDSKLLEYYRKLDRAGQLNLKQRQRMNVLAAAERMRLAREKRDKVLNP